MTVEDIKAQLIAQRAKQHTSRFYTDYIFDAWWPAEDWEVASRFFSDIPKVFYDEDNDLLLERSDLDVRIGNPDRYDKGFYEHPVVEAVHHFLKEHAMDHDIFYSMEMEGPHTLIVRLANERDKMFFYMRFGEYTAFKT